MERDQKAKKLKNTDPLFKINGSDHIPTNLFFDDDAKNSS